MVNRLIALMIVNGLLCAAAAVSSEYYARLVTFVKRAVGLVGAYRLMKER